MGHPGDTQGPERAALAQVQRPGSASPPQPRNRSAGGQVCFITKNLLRKQNQCCKLGTEKEQWVPRPPSHGLEPGEGLGPSSWQEPPPPDRMGLPPLGSWWGGGRHFPSGPFSSTQGVLWLLLTLAPGLQELPFKGRPVDTGSWHSQGPAARPEPSQAQGANAGLGNAPPWAEAWQGWAGWAPATGNKEEV